MSLKRSLGDHNENSAERKKQSTIINMDVGRGPTLAMMDDMDPTMFVEATSAVFSSSSSSSSSSRSFSTTSAQPARPTSSKSPDHDEKFLTVLTWNVDGHGEYDRLLRTEAILDIILNMSPRPDIICLQEVVPITRNLINERLSRQYDERSHLERQHTRGLFFTMMFVSNDITYVSGERVSFRCGTGMDRDLLQARVELGGRFVSVYTSHLDSMPASSDRRCAQFQEICRLLHLNIDCAIWCGDSNLSDRDGRGEEDVYAVGEEGLRNIDDAWKVSGAAKLNGPGLSVASTWCRMYPGSTKTDNNVLHARFDRFYSNQSPHMRVVDESDSGFFLVGNDPLPADLIQQTIAAGYQTPSDHYGVCVTYAIATKATREHDQLHEPTHCYKLPDHYHSPTSAMDDTRMTFSPHAQRFSSSSSSQDNEVSCTPPENNFPNTFVHAFSPPQPRKSRRPTKEEATIFTAIPMIGDDDEAAAVAHDEDNDIFHGGHMYD